ncbi:hypothetical protein [Rhizobium sp. RM]|uniref:hypothetical protein n=1 Tax=Rhizobium sp. RM TaxID=2748079 RepID=UPI00110DF610|nr:hypothetical protein [Rhizobium sp. RM]NWJ24752.1 hypothetical protein [Rhizobium sp. RM]TMV16552.1 hypothetical protein BJG94_19130 [Rhizobium sp. Td3]
MKPNESVIDFPSVSDAARALLREVRFAGHRMSISGEAKPRALALELCGAGYVRTGETECDLRLTGFGEAYLDQLMRAH